MRVERLRFLLYVCSGVILMGCSSESSKVGGVEDSLPLIDVKLYGEVAKDKDGTRGGYQPNEDDGSQYDFSWDAGDAVSVYVPDSEGNANQRFEVYQSSSVALFTGKVVAWSDPASLCAVAPYVESGRNITASSSGYRLSYSLASQSVMPTVSGEYDEGLLLAIVDDATAESEDKYSIPSLAFKQALSTYQLSLSDIPNGEVVTQIGFKSADEIFVASADIDFAKAEAVEGSEVMSREISADVDGASSDGVVLNFRLLPVDLSEQPLVLYVVTGSGDEAKEYVKSFDRGVNFARNSFVTNSEGALSLATDFLAPPAEVTLDELSDESYPSSDYWIVTDATATDEQMLNLYTALATIATNTPDRRLTVEFTALESLSYGALYSCTPLKSLLMPCVKSIGDESVSGCTNLESISAPVLESVGINAFRECEKLNNVYLPAATQLCSSAFDGCSSLSNIEIDNVTTIEPSVFKMCTSLESISLPKVNRIGESAFIGCSSLVAMELATDKLALLDNLDIMIFAYMDSLSESYSENIDLTIGVQNSSFITGRDLTCGNTYTFKSITYTKGESSVVTGTVESGFSVIW